MKRFLPYFKCFLIVLTVFYVTNFQAQNDSISGIERIDYHISKHQIKQADSVLKSQISNFINQNQIDSLYQFPFYVGKIELLKSNPKNAVKKAEAFIKGLKQKTSNTRTLFKAYLNISDFYVEVNDNSKSLEAAKEALKYANSLKDATPEELGKINYIIGSCYYSLYDIANAIDYFKISVKTYEKSNKVAKHILADAYNGVAVSMWTTRKLDSAEVYFDKAIKATEKSDLENFDRLYYINAFKFNLALVYDDYGKINDAINMKKVIISNLQKIINGSKDKELVLKSKRLQASSLSNLAAMYNDIGFYTKSYNMLKYAYKKKKEVYDANSPRIASTLSQIALSEIALREFDKSLKTSKKGLEILRKSNDTYFSLEADNLYLQAKAYAEKNDTINALKYYNEAETVYKKIYPNAYSRDYIVLLRDYALFLGLHNKKDEAIHKIKKVYDYLLRQGQNDDFLLASTTTNIADIYYLNSDYKNSLFWSQKGSKILDSKLNDLKSAIDSVKIEFHKPDLLLLECKSKYKLRENKNKSFLDSISVKIDKAMALLELRKKTLFNQKDISELLEVYKSVTTFSKQINYDLYVISKDETYLNKFLELHESTIYNTIRSRLNFSNKITFANVPDAVLKREKNLKEAIAQSLDTEEENLNTFLKSEKNWNSFLDSIKRSFPKYYKMRYATIKQPLDSLQQNIPKNTTVVRYLFIDKILYATVIDKTEKQIFKLDSKNVEDYTLQLANHQSKTDSTITKLHQLYLQLWKPFEKRITTKNIIIIPDGPLFNLSFETLTPSKINSFKALATLSLLAKHNISYNYSLLLLDEHKKTVNYQKDFIAFAPEFNDKMKTDYRVAITDSIAIDKTYLSLLPQPFSVDLAKEYSRLFNGDFFINENASKQIFKNEANEHKIIHIGTHAESNNISPELSRLIFAKNNEDEDNSLYTFEIYNENLNSNLAILTACETGKPTYQSGEGMISLAHAFNYAGSESILTSLWKIDEKSSSQIINLFYKNIKKGLPKDEALRQAKLDYITTEEGRVIAPQYWAGLVLIGDASPIDLNNSLSFIWYLFFGIIAIIIAYALIRKKRKA